MDLSILLLAQLGLADRFAAICGQDTFGTQKPDPEVLRRTVHEARGCGSAECWAQADRVLSQAFAGLYLDANAISPECLPATPPRGSRLPDMRRRRARIPRKPRLRCAR